ncbi:DUF4387 domain-containing protein [Jatrophihabitans lederbergiae]|uniref:DUF4387 domain-containing protein n=1 Tax=Jatrophihabitans lederbergiae TaxID=3075547 RepID=A0ABU2JG65_9ACTN|nr:DUF4387 domain-containing protein [Jatrophihabitans sp. DSM 44399]MDT0263728.1 DUF4387 domain-containing protein [Jatrophihabitans sp. DSM 44399]
MPEPTSPATLGELAVEIRSKNAGPFWVTLEAFMPDEQAYRTAEELITAAAIAQLYRVSPEQVQLFTLPYLRVIKASFPRPVSQGSLHDRDMHAGQQHIPLAALPLVAP